jgi:hypothetical protein
MAPKTVLQRVRCSIVFECTMNRWRDYFHFLCSTYLFVCVIVCLENVYPGSEESSSGSWAKIGIKKKEEKKGCAYVIKIILFAPYDSLFKSYGRHSTLLQAGSLILILIITLITT